MKKLLLLFAAIAAYGQTASISDTLTSSVGGAAWTGRITVALNAPGSAQPLYSGTTSLAGWQYVLCVGVTGADCSAETAAGSIALTLYTNSAITPSGTSYAARYQPTKGAAWAETWVVSSGNTKLYQIRATTVPTPTTTVIASQIAGSGATSGQALVWNGSAWAPATVGTVYTASAVIDAVAVPDGTCVLDSTAVTVTGAAHGGRPTLGSSYQPPEGVHVIAKVTGPNTMKVEICNVSGASYNPASATYYFGVTL